MAGPLRFDYLGAGVPRSRVVRVPRRALRECCRHIGATGRGPRSSSRTSPGSLRVQGSRPRQTGQSTRGPWRHRLRSGDRKHHPSVEQSATVWLLPRCAPAAANAPSMVHIARQRATLLQRALSPGARSRDAAPAEHPRDAPTGVGSHRHR
jgi:hypothetical protein